MGDNVFQKPVASSPTQQIRCNDEHTGGGDPILIIGHEHVDPRMFQRAPPNALGVLSRLHGRADLGHPKQGKERRKVIEAGEPSDWHG
jgi:hypothetical protein